MMKKDFENPVLEVVRFNGNDIVRTSCCDVGGIDMGIDDEVCPSQDGECTCTPDAEVNCN
jgi:hypothetical protein